MNLVTTVIVEPNTFKFFVDTKEDKKFVVVDHHTDFAGTILERDFPNGDTTITSVEVSTFMNDVQAVNLIGKKFLKDWVDLCM